VFVFDEARGLLVDSTGKEDKSAFFALRNAAGHFPRYSGIVLVVMDTTSRISNLIPPPTKPEPSTREVRGNMLYDPIYLLPTLDLGVKTWGYLEDKPSWIVAFDLKRLYKYGRPLWTTYSELYEPSK
jgi:hypothetical protein